MKPGPAVSTGVGYGDLMARWLSRVFHPFIVVIPTLFLAVYFATSSFVEAVKWTAASVAIVILPLSIFILIRVRRGHYSDLYVSIRKQRRSLYLVAGVCLISLLAFLVLAGAPRIIVACLYAAVVANAVGAFVNRFSKVSVHAAAMAGCTAVLFSLSVGIGLAVAAIALVLGWARVRTEDHSLSQVIMGWAIAAACVWIVFGLYL
jgi:membrane-associated phospholipid phosphatase